VIVPEGLIIVFARAPIPGRVKTRLIPLLGPEGAAALQESMTSHGLAVGLKAGLGPVELWTSDHPDHPFFRRCHREHGIGIYGQPEGDLGLRMAAAFEEALARTPWALLMGTDCPCLNEADLREAAEALVQGKEAVLAPAEDGGYVLLGLRRFDRAIFEGIAWGTADVLEETRSRLRALGWMWHETRTCWDVDLPEDVARLRREGLLDPGREG
jgi:rSAM/selenodomain-associated transferase 1